MIEQAIKIKQELRDKARKVLFRRKLAYQTLFLDGKGNLSIAGQRVIKDLTKFCFVDQSTIRKTRLLQVDPLEMARLEGRREVFNRLQQSLKLTDEQIFAANSIQDI